MDCDAEKGHDQDQPVGLGKLAAPGAGRDVIDAMNRGQLTKGVCDTAHFEPQFLNEDWVLINFKGVRCGG